MHKKQWDFLKGKFENNQLSHAYFFSGQDQANKTEFAKEFLKFINCLDDKKPCQKCQNCKMIDVESFPDLMIVRSKNSESSEKNEKDMMSVEVDQIRQVQNFLSLMPYYGKYKAVIVEDAERMTFEAQNSFLKTLEEPKGKTVIILVSCKPQLLLATVLSRCQEIRFFYNGKYEISKDEEDIIKNLEKIMQGSLAEKFQYAKNTNLESGNFNKILGALRKYFRQLLISEITGKERNNKYSVPQIKKIIDLIEEISSKSYVTNINSKLALEVLLMEI